MSSPRLPAAPDSRAAPFIRRLGVAVLAMVIAVAAAPRAVHYARTIPRDRVSVR